MAINRKLGIEINEDGLYEYLRDIIYEERESIIRGDDRIIEIQDFHSKVISVLGRLSDDLRRNEIQHLYDRISYLEFKQGIKHDIPRKE